jgi:hypothetical protein
LDAIVHCAAQPSHDKAAEIALMDSRWARSRAWARRASPRATTR